MATVLLQVRMGSSRFPGKALKEIGGKPMLYYTVETLKKSPAVDRIILATSTKSENDPLEDFAKRFEIAFFRGSESNVLERLYFAATKFKDRYYFKAGGDNPIIDYENPQRVLSHLKENCLDYVQEKRMPLGSVVEVFTFDALEKCYNSASREVEKEHVTLFMKKSKSFYSSYIRAPLEYSYPELRLSVDFPNDFRRVGMIIERLYDRGIPSFNRVIAFAKESGWI
jgi:spore coat polysaccharide biosynthesis protein SpsF (cytidylyltransferase family)